MTKTSVLAILLAACGANADADSGPPAEDAAPDAPPAATTSGILFQSDRTGTNQIYVIQPDGTGERQLTSDPALSATDAHWSPDGATILFTGTDVATANSQMYEILADGGGRRQLTFPPGHSTGGFYSPADGATILFNSDRGGSNDLYLLHPDGSATQLTNTPDIEGRCHWSPDGTRIAYRFGPEGAREIYVMNADGTGVMNLTANPADDLWPTWSPDGTSISFASNRDSWSGWVMDPDGANQRHLNLYGSLWSPDARWVAFGHAAGGSLDVYISEISGIEIIRLTRDPASDVPTDWR